MAVPFSNKLPRLPKGFQSVLKEIAREVLKNKPDNIYEFGSRYLDQCLRVRNANRIKDRFEKIQIQLLDSCIFHKDRTNFDKITREVERAKIIPKAYSHRLAMAICSCKRRKINIHVLMTEKNLQKRLTDLKERVAMETNWPDNLLDYLNRILGVEDLTLKQESICRFIYVLHEALFYKSYDLLTRAAITSNPTIGQQFLVKKREEIVILKHKEEMLTIKTEENLRTKTNQNVIQKPGENTITVTGNVGNKLCDQGIATIKIDKTRNQISEEAWFKRWQKPKLSSCDSHIDYYNLATDLKENLADRFEIKVLSKQYYKRQSSFRKQNQTSVLTGGHCRNCCSAFCGLEDNSVCIHHPGYIKKKIWTCCGSKCTDNIITDHSESWCKLTEKHFYTPQRPQSKTGHSPRERCIKNNFRKLVNPTKINSSADVLHDYLQMFYI